MIQCAKIAAGCITAARIGNLNLADLVPAGLEPVRIVPNARAVSLGQVGYALDTHQLVDRRNYKNVTPTFSTNMPKPPKPDNFWKDSFRRAYEQ